MEGRAGRTYFEVASNVSDDDDVVVVHAAELDKWVTCVCPVVGIELGAFADTPVATGIANKSECALPPVKIAFPVLEVELVPSIRDIFIFWE